MHKVSQPGSASNRPAGGAVPRKLALLAVAALAAAGNEQYTVRNSAIGGANGCPNGLWNTVYSGVVGAPAAAFSGQCQQNTVVPTSPVTEEEPFLYTDSQGDYQVFVPAVQHDSSGPSWSSGTEAGTSIPLSSFFVANPSTPVVAIDLALAYGKNLILSPGVYNLDRRPGDLNPPGYGRTGGRGELPVTD